MFLLAYGVQLTIFWAEGAHPTLAFGAIDPKTGMAGGLGFAIFLVLGNFVKSFMEEGLFRGVMLRLFEVRLAPRYANLLQAALFTAWHMVWPAKRLLRGGTDLPGALSEAATLLIAAFVIGLVYGYMYQKTGSLWTSWLAHTLNNSGMNLVHIRTAAGLDEDVFVLQLAVVVGSVLLVMITKALAERFRMPEIRPWGQPV